MMRLNTMQGAQTSPALTADRAVNPVCYHSAVPAMYLSSQDLHLSLPVMQVLLTDTVGFIQKLPTQLVAAFRATLEEITEASLLLHVVDVSHPNAAAQTQAVMQVCLLQPYPAARSIRHMPESNTMQVHLSEASLNLQCLPSPAAAAAADRCNGHLC